ncbi:MAG: hypothetical protein Q7S49_00565 [bacterium]|nr:hypothetical protein [bacterium]
MQTTVNGLALAATQFLLVKFYFTNPAHIPEGIKRIERKDEQELIRKRIEILKAATPADTKGFQVVNNVLNTSAEQLFAGLRAAGLVLLDVHNWKQVKSGRMAKYVVSFAWSRPQEGLEEVADVNADAFTKDVVWFCHAWQNPTSVNTVEFVGRQPGQKAKHVALVEDNHVVVRPV